MLTKKEQKHILESFILKLDEKELLNGLDNCIKKNGLDKKLQYCY